MENGKRIFDTKDKIFVEGIPDNDTGRYIISEGTGIYISKTPAQVSKEREIIVSIKEEELGRELTKQEKKNITVEKQQEIYTGDILGDAYCAVCYIDYCEKCKSFEPFNLNGCLACEGSVKLCELNLEELHIIGNKFQHERLLYPIS